MRLRFPADNDYRDVDNIADVSDITTLMTMLSTATDVTKVTPETAATAFDAMVNVEITLASQTVNITARDFDSIYLSRFDEASLTQLVNYIKICNYLEWISKLSTLQRLVAWKLCQRRYINVDYRDYSHFVIAEARPLWQLRLHYFGQPQQSELLALQLLWWQMLADPVAVIDDFNRKASSHSSSHNEDVSCLLALESDNIKEILLHCSLPVYLGQEANYKLLWTNNQRNLHLFYPIHPERMLRAADYEIGWIILPHYTPDTYLLCIEPDVLRDLDRLDYNVLRNYYNHVMEHFCQRYEPMLRCLYCLLVLNWCQVQFQADNVEFDPDFYMLRFPEPARIACYTDVVDVDLEALNNEFIHSLGGLEEQFNIQLSANYRRDVDRLAATRRDMVRSNHVITSTFQALKLRLGSRLKLLTSNYDESSIDTKLKQLCQQHNIAVVNYDRQLAIRVLSHYLWGRSLMTT